MSTASIRKTINRYITMNDSILTDQVQKLIGMALEEDIGSGDLSTNAIIRDADRAYGLIKAKANGIVCGLPVFKAVFRQLSDGFQLTVHKNDGDLVSPGNIIAEFSGSKRSLLSAERTALNFLQRLSGVATTAYAYVEAIAGTGCQILDTRKTMPGFRLLDKYAVQCGGATNHRIGLFDRVMLKENHIQVAGGITGAVKMVRDKVPANIEIEVETTNKDEVLEALVNQVDVIMLDNMSLEEMREAVALVAGKCKLEASGGITLANVRAVAETGVDYISVGALTHSVMALDISMIITDK
jgi:nicotinate-nucleotide pyrophosphorylase (carboxylating)